ncbi:MAG: hypothetical protein II777_08395, partial [Clostridia bacterium]|nr:hypothetical protein [Clostridia bacterium]
KNRISLAPGFPENELSNFRGFAEANFTREAYLTAEGDFTAASAARGGWGFPRKKIFLFHSVRKNRISLAPGFPENELSNFRGFAEANFTREAYLTAEGDFTAASAARGGGSPAGDVSQ